MPPSVGAAGLRLGRREHGEMAVFFKVSCKTCKRDIGRAGELQPWPVGLSNLQRPNGERAIEMGAGRRP